MPGQARHDEFNFVPKPRSINSENVVFREKISTVIAVPDRVRHDRPAIR